MLEQEVVGKITPSWQTWYIVRPTLLKRGSDDSELSAHTQCSVEDREQRDLGTFELIQPIPGAVSIRSGVD